MKLLRRIKKRKFDRIKNYVIQKETNQENREKNRHGMDTS